MIALWKNPELIRNARAQLRTGRALTAAGICAVLSVATGFAFAHANGPSYSPPREWGMHFLQAVLLAQVVTLLIGGGISCLHAVQREKDQNTFDFQRVTRLTPLDLALGKLFGAPTLAYFVTLCLVPAGIFAAFTAGVSVRGILAAYLVLVLGSVAGHALALLISVFIPKNASAAAVILFLVVVGVTGSDTRIFHLESVSPFVALSLVERMGTLPQSAVVNGQRIGLPDRLTDMFFGRSVHHVTVLAVLYITFGVWLLLGVVRNIKRDPAVYSLYSPVQSLGFIFYMNLLWIGFLRSLWPLSEYARQHSTGYEAEGTLLGFNIPLLFALGLALLRNRDQMRRRLREIGPQVSRWVESLWPVPYLVGGAAVAGTAAVWFVKRVDATGSDWTFSMGMLRVAFLCAWLARDVLFLQWMNLRRKKRPLMLGVLYLTVFYACALTVFGFLGYFDEKLGRVAATAMFLPSGVFKLDATQWAAFPQVWMLALAVQLAAAGVFAYLHQTEFRELAPQAA